MKKIFAALMALTLIVGAFSFALADSYKMYVFCDPNSNLNIRAKANPHSNTIGRLEFGWDVDVIGEATVNGTTWYKLDIAVEAGNVGWVNGGYLVKDPPTKTNKDIYRVTHKKGVNARKYIGGARRSKLKKNAQVTVLALSKDWAFTNRGYIMTKYLEKVNK